MPGRVAGAPPTGGPLCRLQFLELRNSLSITHTRCNSINHELAEIVDQRIGGWFLNNFIAY